MDYKLIQKKIPYSIFLNKILNTILTIKYFRGKMAPIVFAGGLIRDKGQNILNEKRFENRNSIWHELGRTREKLLQKLYRNNLIKYLTKCSKNLIQNRSCQNF